MATLNIIVESSEESNNRFKAAMRGEAQGHFLSFPNDDVLWRVLTQKRRELLKAMGGQGPMTIRGVARAVGRDVKAVHGDLQALLVAGVLDKAADGRLEFPYDTVHFDFLMKAA